MNPPRIIFAGTPEFAVASLRALVESGRTPVAVLTQPDRPAGRGKHLTASPVKQYAEQQGMPVLQPVTLRDDDMLGQLAALEPDVLIVAAYGLILPQAVLDVPRVGCVNVHAVDDGRPRLRSSVRFAGPGDRRERDRWRTA